MDSHWWYGVAASGLFWGVFLAVPDSFDYVDRFASETVGAMVGLGVLLTWFLLPAALYLDWRAIREDVTWDPTISLWVLTGIFWFTNVSVAIAYAVRRQSAVRGTVPDERWRYAVAGTLVVWLVFFVVSQDDVAALLPPTVVSAGQTALFVAWLGLPAATYLDLGHVQAHTDWDATVPLWMLCTGIPLVGFVVGLLYLGWRQRAIDRADDPTTVTRREPGGTDDDGGDRADHGGSGRAGSTDQTTADSTDPDVGPTAGPGDAPDGPPTDASDGSPTDASDRDANLWDDVAPEGTAGDEAGQADGETTDEESDEDDGWDDVFEGR